MLGQHRSTQRKVPRGADDEQSLTNDMIAGATIRALRLSSGDGIAAECRLDGQSQAGRADLASRRAEGAAKAAEARPAMAERRIVHLAVAYEPIQKEVESVESVVIR